MINVHIDELLKRQSDGTDERKPKRGRPLKSANAGPVRDNGAGGGRILASQTATSSTSLNTTQTGIGCGSEVGTVSNNRKRTYKKKAKVTEVQAGIVKKEVLAESQHKLQIVESEMHSAVEGHRPGAVPAAALATLECDNDRQCAAVTNDSPTCAGNLDIKSE